MAFLCNRASISRIPSHSKSHKATFNMPLVAAVEDDLSGIYRFQPSGSVKRLAVAFPSEMLTI
jgi:hypothetical protein